MKTIRHIRRISVVICLLLTFGFAQEAAHRRDHDRDDYRDRDGVHQNQRQKQSQSSSNSNSNSNSSVSSGGAGGNASTGAQSNSSINNTNYPRQTPMAYAPDSFPSAPCIKGFGGGASSPVAGISFGGGKVDKGCDDRETARAFYNMGNPSAAAKILCDSPAARRAKLSLADCLTLVVPEIKPEPAKPEIKLEPVPSQQPTPQIIVPAPQVTVNIPPLPLSPSPIVTPPVTPKHHVAHKPEPCPEK